MMDTCPTVSHVHRMIRLTPALASIAAISAALVLQGCIARTAASIVTAPVKVVGGAVDMATTSQSEADEKRGRQLRKQDERYAQLDRSFRKDKERCNKGDMTACQTAEAAQREMEAMRGASYRMRD